MRYNQRVHKDGAIVGVADHSGWAVLVSVAGDGTFLDRRRVELLDAGLPTLPHHHECQGLPLEQALALVERVRRSAERHAKASLDAVAAALPAEVRGIALRERPALPDTVAERIRNYRAQCAADGVMYRTALADAAEARGWAVHWYDARNVLTSAPRTLQAKRPPGPPWRKDHQVAMAAAIVAARARGARR
jgi:hypothetical protein